MIGLFSTGDFVRVDVLEPEVWGCRVGLLMGIVMDPIGKDKYDVKCLVSNEEGQMLLIPTGNVRLDFVYDHGKDIFRDKSMEVADEE